MYVVEVTPTAACLIVGKSAFVVMIDERRRYGLPVASGPPPGLSVLSGDGESSGKDTSLTARSLCSGSAPLRLPWFVANVRLSACRLPLPLQLGYRLHRHCGGSRDDLYRSEQLRLHLSYHSTSG